MNAASPTQPADATSSDPVQQTDSVAGTGENLITRTTFRNQEELPFRIRVARTGEVFERAVSVRSEAFARHGHPFSKSKLIIEPADISASSILLCAESKDSGEPVGAMRIEDNRIAEFPLNAELELPEHMRGVPAIMVSRLTVHAGKRGHLARNALCKAMYLYAVAIQAQFIFVLAKPPRDRLYKPMGFHPIFDGDPLLELKANSGIGAKALAAKVNDFESNWRSQGHPLYGFFMETYHPDIELFSAVSGPKRKRRVDDLKFAELPETKALRFNLPIA